jgi:hypothetical protein
MDKTIVTILGVVFILVGLLGFVQNPILGIFAVDTLHNIIHIASGILALWAVNKGTEATITFAKVFGVVYGAVAVLGFLMPSPLLGLITVNMADNLLHVVLAVVFLVIGFGGKRSM